MLGVRTFLYVFEGLQQSVLVARDDGHIDALLRELACDLEAHATRATGDDHDSLLWQLRMCQLLQSC